MIIRIWILLTLAIVGTVSCLLFTDNPIQSSGIFLLFISILASFVLSFRGYILQPIIFFAAFSFSIVLVELYFYNFGFAKNQFILMTTFYEELDSLFTKSIYAILIGYNALNLGYFLMSKQSKDFSLSQFNSINRGVLKYSIILFLSFCILNFFYLVFLFANGDIIQYIRNVSIREYEYKDFGGTGIFIDFGIYAMFYWIYYNYAYEKKFNCYFYIILALVLVIKYSQGRIFQTIGGIIALYTVGYFLFLINAKRNVIKQLISICVLFFLSMILYVYRLRSSLAINQTISNDFLGQLNNFFKFEELAVNLIGEGNVPNLPILMKIIDSWQLEIGYLYGESYLFPFYRLLPDVLKPENMSVSLLVKKQWYEHLTNGALPSTCYGEMFANFGFTGIIVGMFIFGLLLAKLNNLLLKFNNLYYLIIYSLIVSSFVFIYPKGEFDNLNLIGLIIFSMTFIFIILGSKLFKKNLFK
jgi:hypothetical protein